MRRRAVCLASVAVAGWRVLAGWRLLARMFGGCRRCRVDAIAVPQRLGSANADAERGGAATPPTDFECPRVDIRQGAST